MMCKVHAIIIMALSMVVWGIYFLVTDIMVGDEVVVIVTDLYMELIINLLIFYFVEFVVFSWNLWKKSKRKD